jgi:amino acid transporter
LLSFALLLAYALALAYGVALAREIRRGHSAPTSSRLPVLAVTWLIVVWVSVLTTFGEVSENQRVRFCLDPLVLLLDISALLALTSRARAGRQLTPRS